MEQDINVTLNERANTHGDFRDSGKVMQLLKGVMRDYGKNWPILDSEELIIGEMSFTNALTYEQREALEMIQHKIGRILSGNPNEPDHWKDIAGYATLVFNILTTGKSHTGQ